MSSQTCPYAYPLRILARKWSYFVLRALTEPRTFGELSSELRHVTNRMLSIELRKLTSEGLVEKRGATYARTNSAERLLLIVDELARWAGARGMCRECNSQRRCSTCEGFPIAVGVRVHGTKI